MDVPNGQSVIEFDKLTQCVGKRIQMKQYCQFITCEPANRNPLMPRWHVPALTIEWIGVWPRMSARERDWRSNSWRLWSDGRFAIAVVDHVGFVHTEFPPGHSPAEDRWVKILFFICVPLSQTLVIG
mgnify:FL=1|jgi:hypothetical protein